MQNQMQTQVRDQNSKLRKFKKADPAILNFFTISQVDLHIDLLEN